MDREQLFGLTRHWYPIAAAILSSLLNFLSFLIGIKWDAASFVQLSFFSLFGTMAVSIFVILVLYKVSVSGYTQEFTILNSIDDYEILGPHKAIYKRVVDLKVNKPSTFFTTYPPSVDGKLRKFHAYQVNNPNIEYKVSIQRLGGRKSLFLYLDRPLRRGEIIEGLCIECEVINSFGSEYEGVSVGTDPGQGKCAIRISLPKEHPPLPSKADWFLLYGRNQSPIKNGIVEAYQIADGKYIITYDFSHQISQGVGWQCAISWHWKPVSQATNEPCT
jgi:hypothetical protein